MLSAKLESEAAQQSALSLGASTLAPRRVHPLDLILILVRRWRFILKATIGLTVLAVIVVFLLPVRYTAATVIIPPSQNSSGSSAILAQLGNVAGLANVAGAGMGMKNPADMYVSLLRSRTVEEAVVRRFNMMQKYHVSKMSKARLKLEKYTTVSSDVKNGFITISATDGDPRVAADIANGYLDEFRKASAHLALTEAGQRRMFFEQQLQQERNQLTDAENAMKATQQSTGVLQIDSQTRALVESAATIRAQLVARQVQLQTMRSYATDDNPDVVQLQKQISALQEQLARLGGGSEEDAGLLVPKGKIPEAGLEYIRRLRDVKYHETVVELLARQYEMAKIDEAKQGAIIQVVDTAAPPDTRSFPKRTLIIAATFVIGFVLAYLFCVGIDGWQRWKLDPEVERRLTELRGR